MSFKNLLTRENLWSGIALAFGFFVCYCMTLTNARAHIGTVSIIALAALLGLLLNKKWVSFRNTPLTLTLMWVTLAAVYTYTTQITPDNGVKNGTVVPLIAAVGLWVSLKTRSSRAFLKMLPTLATLAFIVTTAECCYDYFMQSYIQDDRVAGNMWIGDANASAGIAFAFGLLAFFSNKDKFIRGAILGVGVAAIASTLSRSGFAALATSLTVIGAYAVLTKKFGVPNSKAAATSAILTLAVPAVALAIMINASKYIAPNISVISRISLMESTLEMVADNAAKSPKKLFFGNGFSTFREHYTQFRKRSDINSAGITVHLDYLEYLYEGGLVYTLGFMTLLSVVVYSLLKQAHRSKLYLGLAAATIYIANFAWFNFAFIAPIFAVTVGVATGVALKLGPMTRDSNLGTIRRIIYATVLLFVVLSIKYSMMIYLISTRAPFFISPTTWNDWTGSYIKHMADKEKSFLATILIANLQAETAKKELNDINGDKEKARKLAEESTTYYFIARHILPVCNDCDIKIASLIDGFTPENEVGSKKKALEFGYTARKLNKVDSSVYYLLGRLELSVNKDIKKATELTKECVENTVTGSYLDGFRCLDLAEKVVKAKELQDAKD